MRASHRIREFARPLERNAVHGPARLITRRVLPIAATALLALVPAASADQVYYGNACGSFTTPDYRIYVSATHVSCSRASRIQREFWLGPRSRKTIVNGGAGAYGYVLLKRYPGWKCGSGSGGGQCTKGKRIASYQVRVK